MNKDKVINIRLSSDLLNDIKKQCDLMGGISVSSFFRMIASEYIQNKKRLTDKPKK